MITNYSNKVIRYLISDDIICIYVLVFEGEKFEHKRKRQTHPYKIQKEK